MTTEERFTRIENALQALNENQAREEGALGDLIVVSRTLLESQKQTTTQIQDLGHALKRVSPNPPMQIAGSGRGSILWPRKSMNLLESWNAVFDT